MSIFIVSASPAYNIMRASPFTTQIVRLLYADNRFRLLRQLNTRSPLIDEFASLHRVELSFGVECLAEEEKEYANQPSSP